MRCGFEISWSWGKCISRLRGSVHCVVLGCRALSLCESLLCYVSQVFLSLGPAALVLVALLALSLRMGFSPAAGMRNWVL